MIRKEDLWRWQREASDEWVKNLMRGITVAETGTGKTIMALFCMQLCRCSTIIIVPTMVLMNQWKENVLKHLNVTEDKIGLYYGEEKNFRPITIAVINSVRPKDLSNFKMVVFDEVHRYMSIENIKPLECSNWKYTLGLTATLKRKDGKEKELQEIIGEVFYVYGTEEARKDKVVNEYTLTMVGVNLTFAEQKKYDWLDEKIKKSMKEFGYNLNLIISQCAKRNFKAMACMKKISQRRKIYLGAEAKIREAIKLVERHKNDRIIIFNEEISTAEEIYQKLNELSYKVGIYHSKKNRKKDRNVLEHFNSGELTILVAVKSLNEGIDIKDANVGIIVGATKSELDMIQRRGRLIRKQEGKEVYIYRLYCRNTKEQDDAAEMERILGRSAEKVYSI